MLSNDGGCLAASTASNYVRNLIVITSIIAGVKRSDIAVKSTASHLMSDQLSALVAPSQSKVNCIIAALSNLQRFMLVAVDIYTGITPQLQIP